MRIVTVMHAPLVNRYVLAVLSVLVSTLLAGCVGTSTGHHSVPTRTTSAPDPLVFRDGLANFGIYSGDGPIVALDQKNGRLLWQRKQDTIPPGVSRISPLLQPTVQDGLIYVPNNYRDTSRAIYYSELEALDPATGQMRWRHKVAPQQDANTELESVPVVANGVVYLASGIWAKGQPHTLHGLVEALDSHSGSVRWSTTLKGPPSTPVVADGRVILLAGPELVALNTSDGSVAWNYTPPGGPFFDMQSGFPPTTAYKVVEGYPAPVAAQQLVFVEATEADSNGNGIGSTWFAVNTSNGSLAWRSARSAPGANFTRPVLNQSGSVLCTSAHASGSRNFVMGLSTSTGKTLWNVPTTAKLAVCATAGDMFYLTESNQNDTAGGMLALNSRTGQQLWNTPTKPPVVAPGVAAPPQSNGLAAVFLPGPIPTGATRVIDTIAVVQLSSGKILWQHDIAGLREIAVTIVGDRLVVPEYALTSSSPAPMLVTYTLQTGSRTWTYTFGHA